jgi:hypothetical protein
LYLVWVLRIAVLKKLEPKILVTLFEVKKTVPAICLMVTSELRMSEAFHG